MCVGGHDAAAVAAGSPACRGHLFTMESLPLGASDLGQGSLDRPLERSRGQWLWRNAPSHLHLSLLLLVLSSKASLLVPVPPPVHAYTRTPDTRPSSHCG